MALPQNMAAWRAQNPVPPLGTLQPARVLTQMPNGTWAMKQPPKAKKKAAPAPKPGTCHDAPRIHSLSCITNLLPMTYLPWPPSHQHQKTAHQLDARCCAVLMPFNLTTYGEAHPIPVMHSQVNKTTPRAMRAMLVTPWRRRASAWCALRRWRLWA